MVRLARRAFDTAGWHAELYLDSADLPALGGLLKGLPRVCVDHLGLSRHGLPHLLRLVERGAWVKATGFGRLNFAPAEALTAIARASPEALVFGTDLPGTRAPQPFADADIQLIADTLAEETLIRKVLLENAVRLYRLASLTPER